ncbi:Concanavalin A-like lectin/glucanase subgroup [Penicillium cf. griseofulvum]|nr:Concanavalin A-like lectin/glucanase subgroup [Penicillium cf. griseofulvum]
MQGDVGEMPCPNRLNSDATYNPMRTLSVFQIPKISLNMSIPHHNPVIPGFAADPSICLIDGTLYLVNSSFHLYPGLPIYMSNDLISWKHIGNAINRPSQLSLSRATTFIGDEHSEQFIIHTADIRSGNWSDPIVFVFPGIDPSLLFDDDGRTYIQLCKTGPEFQIYNSEIDITTGARIVEPTPIWTGWKKGYTEGPHIYKKDGWHYLLCAEGGTFEYHMLSMARSRNIWGPYESYEMNPLYTASGSDWYVQNTGHGDLFQDQNGKWWVIMLGVRMKEGRSIMGRETFLTAVDWPCDGWPTIKPITCDGNLGGNFKDEGQDSFSAAPWVYLRDDKLDQYHMQDKRITLQADPAEFTSADESTTFVGLRQRKLEGTASVTVYKPQHSPSVRAGLALYKDDYRFLTIGYDFHLRQVIFNGLNQAKSISQSETRTVEFRDFISFKIGYAETALQFYFRVDEIGWHDWATLDTAILTDHDFTGPVIGIFAIGDDIEVQFGGVEIDTP